MDVNILLFDDFDTLDAMGPAEVFGSNPGNFHLRYLSVSGDVINSSQGIKVWTDFLIPEEIEGILLIPGGKGSRRILWRDERSLKLIQKAAEQADYCLMVGNASALLAQTGILYRRKIADCPADANWNRMFTAEIERIAGMKVVMDGKFYTCANTMAGIEMSLWLIADILDPTAAEETARRLGYAWEADMGDDIYC